MSETITRREALRRIGRGAALGAGALALGGGGLLGRSAFADAAARGATVPHAKAVIQIWMWGGPSHLDTFDPKPEAGPAYTGPLDAPIPTNVDGIRVGQLMPRLAKMADRYSIIRSMTHGVNGHETASYITQTGHTPGGGKRIVYPSVGAVVSRFKGGDRGADKVPPYVVMTRPLGRFSEAGFLGLTAKPFVTGGDPSRNPFAVEGIVQESVSRERQRARRRLLHELDTLGRAMPEEPRFGDLDACEEKAYEMILGDAGKVFDLPQEPDAMRERYGKNKFGQSCLAARRLVEAGVPFVAINAEGWDTHKKHFEAMNRKLPEMDQGMAALLADLSDRGLLDSTIVWWSGEFGRTPKVLWNEPWNGGRGHYGPVFSAVLAGGGFRGGKVVGASDERGEQVAERPVHPRELIATLYDRLGIDPDAPMSNPRGLDVKVLPPGPDGSQACGRLTEILP
jgi:hypothetical protein